MDEWFAAKLRAAETAFKNQAWHTWHLMAPHVKKMPPLTKFRGDKPAPPRRQTPEELLSIARRWAAAGVGSVR